MREIVASFPSPALRAPSPSRGEGSSPRHFSRASLLPLREKVDRPQAETDEGYAMHSIADLSGSEGRPEATHG